MNTTEIIGITSLGMNAVSTISEKEQIGKRKKY